VLDLGNQTAEANVSANVTSPGRENQTEEAQDDGRRHLEEDVEEPEIWVELHADLPLQVSSVEEAEALETFGQALNYAMTAVLVVPLLI